LDKNSVRPFEAYSPVLIFVKGLHKDSTQLNEENPAQRENADSISIFNFIHNNPRQNNTLLELNIQSGP